MGDDVATGAAVGALVERADSDDEDADELPVGAIEVEPATGAEVVEDVCDGTRDGAVSELVLEPPQAVRARSVVDASAAPASRMVMPL